MTMVDRAPKQQPKQQRLDGDPARAERDFQSVATERDGDGLDSSMRMSELLENQWIQNILPTPPVIPGFHTCWLSTSNQYDSIQWRMRLGYVAVKASEAPEFRQFHAHSGEHLGNITCNEMVLYKIEEAKYQQIMHHFHHVKPQEEASRLRSTVDNLKEEARDKEGTTLISEEGDGFTEVAKSRRAPKQFE